MEEGPIKSFLLSQNCQIEFVFNPPFASHFGGVFERQIGTIRKVLSGLLLEQNTSLTDECLSTLLHEVSAIINCRPLSHINLSDSCIDRELLFPLLVNSSVRICISRNVGEECNISPIFFGPVGGRSIWAK